MKKILIIIIIIITTISCELFDSNYWERVEKREKETGFGCGYDAYGNYHCGYK